jgi:hypothetical protein
MLPPSPPESVATSVSPVRAIRMPITGYCRCARHTCWHARECRSTAYVRIERAPKEEGAPSSSVVLCRECAAPTRRQSVA